MLTDYITEIYFEKNSAAFSEIEKLFAFLLLTGRYSFFHVKAALKNSFIIILLIILLCIIRTFRSGC